MLTFVIWCAGAYCAFRLLIIAVNILDAIFG